MATYLLLSGFSGSLEREGRFPTKEAARKAFSILLKGTFEDDDEDGRTFDECLAQLDYCDEASGRRLFVRQYTQERKEESPCRQQPRKHPLPPSRS